MAMISLRHKRQRPLLPTLAASLWPLCSVSEGQIRTAQELNAWVSEGTKAAASGGTQASEVEYDCSGPPWTAEKREWCCEHLHVASPHYSCSFDCQEGLSSDWQSTWSSAKVAFCCLPHGLLLCRRGSRPVLQTSHATEEAASLSYDCKSERLTWQTSWSSDKKKHCCLHDGVGCSQEALAADSGEQPVLVASEHYDCSVMLSSWEANWDAAKKHWCCLHEGRGCPKDAAGQAQKSIDPYDCWAGWKGEWSQGKKKFCCQTHHRGCSELLPAADSRSVDSSTATQDPQALQATLEAKEDEIATSEPELPAAQSALAGTYDCGNQLWDWQLLWSKEKKDWCCRQRNLGCPGHGQGSQGLIVVEPPSAAAATTHPPTFSPAPIVPSPLGEMPDASTPDGGFENEERVNSGCKRRFEPPNAPLHATDLNGVALPETCFNRTGGIVFVIGDWGGVSFPPGTPPKPADRRAKNFRQHRKFVIGADDTAQQNIAEEMSRLALVSEPDYIINVGDNFYWGGITVKCGVPPYRVRDYTGQWETIFENVYKGPGLSGKQWLGVLGNHDYGGFMFTAGWDQAIGYTWTTESPSTGRWVTPAQYWSAKVHYVGFSVDYYFIDSNWFNARNPLTDEMHNMCGKKHNKMPATCGPQGPTSLDDCPTWFASLWKEQESWLKRILRKSTAQWQVIVTHFPPTWGADWWKQTCDTYGIDLVITGHVHKQEVHYMDEVNHLKPTAYIVSGGGGGITSESMPSADGYDDQYGFVQLTYTKDEIIIKALSHRGILRSTHRVKPRPAALQLSGSGQKRRLHGDERGATGTLVGNRSIDTTPRGSANTDRLRLPVAWRFV